MDLEIEPYSSKMSRLWHIAVLCIGFAAACKSSDDAKTTAPVARPTDDARTTSVVPPGDAGDARTRRANTTQEPLNPRILEIIKTYPARGGYARGKQPGHGTTRDIYLDGKEIAKKGTDGSHCVGLTFEVFWRVLSERPGGVRAAGIDVSRAKALRHIWFVPNDGGQGVAAALPKFGLGQRVARWEDARPGDFVQGWFNSGRGHAVIFLAWKRDAKGTIVGMRYWSSQPQTGGIGVFEHGIGSGRNHMNPRSIYISRAIAPKTR